MTNDVTLTDEQQIAVEKIKEFLADKDKREFLFIGPAGSGKTFTLKYAIKSWTSSKELVKGATVSHAAKAVLSESIGDIAQCYTILQLLAMKPVWGKTGKNYERIKNKAMPIKDALLIVIDECSMIDEEMLDLIRKSAAHNSKIIFTGDSRQLPPVSDDDKSSPTFLIKDYAELTKSRRFSGPIGEVAQFYRAYVDYAEANGRYMNPANLLSYLPVQETEASLVAFTKNREYFDYMVRDYIKVYHNNARILCFRNDIIDSYNESMREMIYGDIRDTICVGEKVVLNAPYKSQGREPVYFHNGEIIEVDDVSISYIDVSFINPEEVEDYEKGLSYHQYKVYDIYVDRGPFESHVLHHIHPDSYPQYFRAKNLLEKIAKETKRNSAWANFRRFNDTFLNFSYLYAQSSHKAQGQSIDHVFVLADDILSTGVSWETKLKSLYVAATRAKKSLFVLMK